MKDLEPLPVSDKISGAPHPSEATTIFGQDSAQQQFLNAFETQTLPNLYAPPRPPMGWGGGAQILKAVKT